MYVHRFTDTKNIVENIWQDLVISFALIPKLSFIYSFTRGRKLMVTTQICINFISMDKTEYEKDFQYYHLLHETKYQTRGRI